MAIIQVPTAVMAFEAAEEMRFNLFKGRNDKKWHNSCNEGTKEPGHEQKLPKYRTLMNNIHFGTICASYKYRRDIHWNEG